MYRVGGDEFTAILRNEDYQNRETLVKQFEMMVTSINSSTENRWEQVHVSMGIAVFDPLGDSSVNDVVHRADKIMYENKRVGKAAK